MPTKFKHYRSRKPAKKAASKTAKELKKLIEPKRAQLTDTALADVLFKHEKAYQRKKREFEAKLEPMKAIVEGYERELLERMLKQQLEAISTKLTTIAIRRTTFAELYDDTAFFEYVGANKAWELVRKQPVVTACRERWDDKQEIPGVRPGTKTELSINARGKSR